MSILDSIARLWRGPDSEQSTNLGEELSKALQSREFQENLQAASPFLIGSGLAWPMFWIYRGIEWSRRSGHEALPLYIRRTFFQAKIMQFAIIATGLFFAVIHEHPHNYLETHDADFYRAREF